MDASEGRARPAWREPMVWLVVAVPLASVLASVALLVSAARSSGNNDAVTDQVQRTAQIQVEDLAADLAARELRLSARLLVEGDRLSLQATGGEFPHGQPLRLLLQHPLQAQADTEVELLPAGNGWEARRALGRGNDWNLTLAPADGRWRLQGRLLRQLDEANLQPALAGP